MQASTMQPEEKTLLPRAMSDILMLQNNKSYVTVPKNKALFQE